MAERADLGFLGDPELHPVLDPLLVCRSHSRLGHPARSCARSSASAIYGAFALGWRGSAQHWPSLRKIAPGAGLSRRPPGLSLHSVVGMDFAASLMPGWQETIFPPYFVVGAMYSGFAMVVCLALWCAGAFACRV